MTALNITISSIIILIAISIIIICIKNKKIFLKGNIILYIPLILSLETIYLYGLYKEGIKNIFKLIFNSLKLILDSFFLNDNSDSIANVCNNNHFETNYYILVILLAFVTSSVLIDLFFKRILNTIKNLVIKKESIIILGYNEDSKIFLKNCRKRKYLLLKNEDKILEKELLDKKITFSKRINSKSIKKYCKQNNVFISFMDNISDILKIIEIFENKNNKLFISVNSTDFYVIDKKISNMQNISLFNKYSLISTEFIMNKSLIDYMNDIEIENALLPSDYNINILMLGFGNVNKQMFLELIKNNQFATLKSNKISTKKVNYFIYSKDNSEDISFNHNLNKIDYLDKTDEYFDWPDKTYNILECKMNINEFDFYNSIKKNLEKQKGFNSIFISLGDEYKNIELANRLDEILYEWNINVNTKIFVRLKNQSNTNLLLGNNIIPYGMTENIINEEVIIKGELYKLAKQRAYMYEKSKNSSSILSPEDVWNNLSRTDKESNINSVFSILHKLSLMNIKITDKNEDSLTKGEFLKIYDSDNEIIYEDNKIIYPIKFSDNINTRNTLAFIEHNRWNTQMISKGFIPMKKDDVSIINNKIIMKKPEKREHASITSTMGLDILFDYCTNLLLNEYKKNNKLTKEEELLKYNDFYSLVENKKYDYSLMDNIYDDINSLGKYLKINK